MKKITIIALHLSFGGVEKAVTNMANLFIERYDVEILCTYTLKDAPAYPLDPRVKVRYLMNEGPNKKEFKESIQHRQVFRVIKEGMKSVRILYQKKRLLKKALQQIHEGIVITTRNEDSVLISNYLDSKVYTIAQLHHDHNFEKKYVHSFEKRYTNIDVFALLNTQLCEEVTEIMKHNTHTRCVVIPNFIDMKVQTIKYEKKQKYLIAVGRLHPVKGFNRMINMVTPILQNNKEWHLQIVGDGEEYNKLYTLIKEKKMESQIHLLGQKNSDEIQTLLSEASIYLMTSHSEGFGIVLVEAMACGLPCIAMDVRVGPRSIIKDKDDGFLIQNGDETAFSKAITNLITNPTLCKEMGIQAQQHAHAYSKEEVSRIWFDELKKGE